MNSARILVAGIGNIFLGDDAFGVEVAQSLAKRKLPSGVRVVDFGIRGVDLSFALLENYDHVILVDAVRRGDAPGTLYLIKPGSDEENVRALAAGASATADPTEAPKCGKDFGNIETHEMIPGKVIAAALAMGANLADLVILGCEPESFGSEETPLMGLTPTVAATVERAIAWIEELIAEYGKEAAHA